MKTMMMVVVMMIVVMMMVPVVIAEIMTGVVAVAPVVVIAAPVTDIVAMAEEVVLRQRARRRRGPQREAGGEQHGYQHEGQYKSSEVAHKNRSFCCQDCVMPFHFYRPTIIVPSKGLIGTMLWAPIVCRSFKPTLTSNTAGRRSARPPEAAERTSRKSADKKQSVGKFFILSSLLTACRQVCGALCRVARTGLPFTWSTLGRHSLTYDGLSTATFTTFWVLCSGTAMLRLV
jgi:hypothetical protein